jgi:membrane associated rhomboid family serine protease
MRNAGLSDSGWRIRFVLPKPRPITIALLTAISLVFVVQLLIGYSVEQQFALWSQSFVDTYGKPYFHPWQLATYGFLHHTGNWVHVFVNTLGLYIFGCYVERVLGPGRYLLYFITCVVAAGALHLVMMQLMARPFFYVVGASGGVFGVLTAFALFFPRRQIWVIPTLFSVSAKMLAIVYGTLELAMGLFVMQYGAAHFAHLGGMAAGYILIRYWRRGRTR